MQHPQGEIHAAGGYGPPPGGGFGGPPPGGFGGPPAGGFGAPPGGAPPPPGGFGPPAYPPPVGQYPNQAAAADSDVKNVLALILNIKALLACGCMSGGIGAVLSIVGIVYAVQAGTAKSNGDFVTAKAKAKTSLILGGVNVGLGLLGFLAYFAFVAIAGNTR